jgi:hypothetical protein
MNSAISYCPSSALHNVMSETSACAPSDDDQDIFDDLEMTDSQPIPTSPVSCADHVSQSKSQEGADWFLGNGMESSVSPTSR